MITIEYINDVSHKFSGTAGLYKLSEPVVNDYSSDSEPTEYVVISTANVMFSGIETYIFASDADGNVTNWMEFPGSMRGASSHHDVIENSGWVMV